jgi:hypothetical protein
MSDVTVLRDWATENGCVFNSAEVRVHPRGGYGLFNSCSTDVSDIIALFIPQSIVISIELIAEEAEQSEELREALLCLPDTPTLEPCIAVFLLYQLYLRRKRLPTKWDTYLDFVPSAPFLPVSWSQHEIELLQATTMPDVVPRQLQLLQSMFENLSNNGSWFSSFSFDEFVLAYTWTITRTIEDPTTHAPVLVPILDMANHSSSRTAFWERTETGFELHREPFPLSSNQELCILYHTNRGSAETLFRYGFIEDTDPSHCSSEVILMNTSSPHRIPRGNIFRIQLSFAMEHFDDLSFLTYENWYVLDKFD